MKLYYTLFQALPWAGFVLDEMGIIRDCNRAVTEQLGYSTLDLIHTEMVDLAAAEDRQNLQDLLKFSKLNVSSPAIELHLYSWQRIAVWMKVTICKLQQLGQKDAFVCLCEDLRAQKQAEKCWRDRAEQLRMIVDSLPGKVAYIDRERRYQFVNKKYGEWSQISVEKLLGQTVEEFMGDQGYRQIRTHVEAALSGQAVTYEFTWRFEDGRQRYLVIHYIPHVNEHGEVLGCSVVCHDLTERKQVEEKLQQFNRELERQVQTRTLLLKQALAQEKQLNLLRSCIVSTISHEYRTPLAIIQSSAEILERYYPKLTHEKILAHCQRVQASTKQLDHLVSQMLMVGQAQSTDLKCYRDAVDLKDFCCRVIDEMNAAAPSVTIAFTQQGHHTIAHLDETLLHHILTNLLSNAIKYSDPNSIVELELTCTEQAASFSLSDTGIGIPQAEISQLFEYFYRASNVGTRPGIGLGLAIVKQCVDLHGGTIVIDSAEGLGTKVTVKLPFGKFSMT